ncbi:MAG TPA: DUF2142 domain-containing protein [Thermoanaerobaculia bacterium]
MAPEAAPVSRLTPDRLVLALGLAGGLLLVFVTPPFQVPDEPAHFFRAYQVATAAAAEPGPGGGIGYRLPASLRQLAELCTAGVAFHPGRRLPPGLLTAAWSLPLAPERRVFMPAGSLTLYTPVPYLAAAAALAAGRLLALRPLALLYLARLGNLAAALAVSWIAVRIAPAQRWLLALLALTPMAMFERSSASADALTDALPLLLVSCLLSLVLRRAADPAGESHPAGSAGGSPALLLATAFLVAAAKGVYFLLDLLVFLVPPGVRAKGCAAGRARSRAVAGLWAGGLAAAVAGAGISAWVTHRFANLGSPRLGVHPEAQLRGVLAAPLRFLGLAAADYVHHLPRYGAGFVGIFGWLDTPLPKPSMVLWGLLLLAAALTGGDPALALAAWQRRLAVAVTVAVLLLLSLSQYVTWTPLGAGFVDGLQGRYFLPVAPVAAILFYNRRFAARGAGSPLPAAGAAAPARPAAAGWLYGGLSVAFTVLTLLCIWFRYHGA